MRDTALQHLHPLFRAKVEALEIRLRAGGSPLRLYEGARSPWRQASLYALGRYTSGRTVTSARPWQSMHQYGLAADFVALEERQGRQKQWRWPPFDDDVWSVLRVTAEELGLRCLDRERPHVQWPARISDLYAGIYPAGGDTSWREWITRFIEQWGGTPRTAGGATHNGAPPAPGVVGVLCHACGGASKSARDDSPRCPVCNGSGVEMES